MPRRKRKKSFRIDRTHLASLVGLSVRLDDGKPYGRVTAAYNFGAGDVVEILKSNGKIEMLPYKPEFLQLAADKLTFVLQPFEFIEAKAP